GGGEGEEARGHGGASQGGRQQYRENALVALQQPKAGVPRLSLGGDHGHLQADYSIAANQGRWPRRRTAMVTHAPTMMSAARTSQRSMRWTSAKTCCTWSAKRNARKKPKGTLTTAAKASADRNFHNG